MVNTLIFDRGHATLDANGKYATKGKMATLPDGRKVYEGKINELYTIAMAAYAVRVGFNVEYTVKPTDPADPSLFARVLKANNSRYRNSSIFISVHNNAANGKAVGTEIFSSVGQTLSDVYANAVLSKYKEVLPKRVMRLDYSDKDADKESNFYVLAKTTMPAILLELGFFDTPTEYDWLMLETTINTIARATVDAILETVKSQYGEEAWANRHI
jgi:N-acetylmuramoyl-L-alanine amidase